MWVYSTNDELYHHGVLGMKWGVRRSNKYSGMSKRQLEIAKKTRGITKDIESFKGHEGGVYTKKGKQVLSSKEVKDCVEALTAMKNKQISKINAKYDKRAEAVTKDILSFADSKDGITTKNGKVVLSKQDVSDIVEGLKKVRDSYL